MFRMRSMCNQMLWASEGGAELHMHVLNTAQFVRVAELQKKLQMAKF